MMFAAEIVNKVPINIGNMGSVTHESFPLWDYDKQIAAAPKKRKILLQAFIYIVNLKMFK